MLEIKEQTDKEGYTYLYSTIEDLCEQIVCGGSQCPRHPRCLEQKEEDCCYEYNEKLEELEDQYYAVVATMQDGSKVNITLDDEFVVHDIKVIEGEKGLFIAMPSKKSADGEYRDIAHPITQECRKMFEDAVLEAYKAETETM